MPFKKLFGKGILADWKEYIRFKSTYRDAVMKKIFFANFYSFQRLNDSGTGIENAYSPLVTSL